jgi:hypothetical protein
MDSGEPSAGHKKLPQLRDTPLTTLRTPLGTALYLYARSGDSVVSETVGQDYVAFRYGPRDLAFAVCDGVGQSFMGDLAARIVGDGLVDWLWGVDRPADAEAFSEAVTGALNAMVERGSQQVAAFELPAHLPPILVQALENQRAYGSESMFVAGRLALGESNPWIALCWLGDSPVAAIDIDGELVDLGPKGHTSERWNSGSGVKGPVHAWVGGAENVARVAGYTDGLAVADVPTDETLVSLMARWQTSPPADDASLFDIRLAPSPETTGEPVPPIQARKALPSPVEAVQPGEAEPEVDELLDTRPIVVDMDAIRRTPVTSREPIQARKPEGPAVASWRPLLERGEQADAAVDLPPETRQQIQMWQQAALLGLTSAALAMVMVERLLLEQDSGGDGGQD